MQSVVPGISPKEALKRPLNVAPAKAGAQVLWAFWIPAGAGMTTFPEFP